MILLRAWVILLRGCATRRKLSLTELFFGGEGLYRYFFKPFYFVCFMFSVLVFALLAMTFLFVCAQIYIFLYLLSLRQEFGKRILRGAAFLLETVRFDCKEVVCSFYCGEGTLW